MIFVKFFDGIRNLATQRLAGRGKKSADHKKREEKNNKTRKRQGRVTAPVGVARRRTRVAPSGRVAAPASPSFLGTSGTDVDWPVLVFFIHFYFVADLRRMPT